MGAAKRRGTFEQRKAEAIVSAEKARIERQEKERLRRANMTPAQRKAEHDRKVRVASVLGMVAAVSDFGPY